VRVALDVVSYNRNRTYDFSLLLLLFVVCKVRLGECEEFIASVRELFCLKFHHSIACDNKQTTQFPEYKPLFDPVRHRFEIIKRQLVKLVDASNVAHVGDDDDDDDDDDDNEHDDDDDDEDDEKSDKEQDDYANEWRPNVASMRKLHNAFGESPCATSSSAESSSTLFRVSTFLSQCDLSLLLSTIGRVEFDVGGGGGSNASSSKSNDGAALTRKQQKHAEQMQRQNKAKQADKRKKR
jgi:hypothetical protein